MPGSVRGERIVAARLRVAALLWGSKRPFKGRHEWFQTRHAACHQAIAELQLRTQNRVDTHESRIGRVHLIVEILEVEDRSDDDSVRRGNGQ